ncbi:MAG: hypothetical protein ABH828_05005 [archaeon]
MAIKDKYQDYKNWNEKRIANSRYKSLQKEAYKADKSRLKHERAYHDSQSDGYHGGEEPSVSPHLLLFFAAIAIHIFLDVYLFNLRRDGGSIPLMLGAYIVLTLFAVLFVYKSGLSSETWTIAGISLAAFLLPFINKFVNANWVTAVLILVPVWGIYLMFNPGDSTFLAGFGKWYLIIVLILGVYALLTSSIVNSQMGALPASAPADVSSAVDVIKHFFIDNTKNLGTSILGLPGKIGSKINQTFSMSYFTGQVEQNEAEPLGVYLEDLRAAEPVFYENNTIIILANLRGKSFEGVINVNNYCFINSGNKRIANGKVIPFNPELFYDESRPIECVIEDNLKKGSYTVTLLSTFDFPTWGYVEYTFVDRETRLAYYSQGKDINYELSIPRKAITTYTNGPVSIGSNIRDLPIVMYPDSYQNFGVTVANIWPQGHMDTLKTLEVHVPEGIMLENCLPKTGTTSPGDNGYTIYTFKLETPKDTFSTELCEMKFVNSDNFLNGNLKVTKTFAIKADYRYSLEKTINIRVMDI